MKTNLYAVAVLVAVLVIAGCSANYGKIRKPTGSEAQISVKELSDNWEDYDIYYTTRTGRSASAVMFDPKSDDKKLVGKSWRKISDPVTLAKSVRSIQVWYRSARVGIIQSPDNQVFGYMYYPSHLNIPVEMLDERTIYVSTLPLPKSAP